VVTSLSSFTVTVAFQWVAVAGSGDVRVEVALRGAGLRGWEENAACHAPANRSVLKMVAETNSI